MSNRLTNMLTKSAKNIGTLMAALGLMFVFVAPVFAQGTTTPAPTTNTPPGASSTTPPAAGGSVTGPADVDANVCQGIEATGGQCSSNNGDSFKKMIETVINVLSIAVGAVCVIMIIIGGFRYVVSAGDSNAMSGAKNTILYAIVGLVIVLFAQVIVQFVYSNVTG